MFTLLDNYCDMLVMISIDLSETTQKTHWKSETKFSPMHAFVTGSATVNIYCLRRIVDFIVLLFYLARVVQTG